MTDRYLRNNKYQGMLVRQKLVKKADIANLQTRFQESLNQIWKRILIITLKQKIGISIFSNCLCYCNYFHFFYPIPITYFWFLSIICLIYHYVLIYNLNYDIIIKCEDSIFYYGTSNIYRKSKFIANSSF